MTIEERIQKPDGTVEVMYKKECKDYFRYFSIFLRGLTIVMLATNIAAFCILIKFAVTANSSRMDALEKAFVLMSNVGFCLICIGLALAEFQWVPFLRRVQVLYYWGARGVGCIWMGIQVIAATKTIGSALAAEIGTDSDPLVTFALVSGWMILSAGLLLGVMSALCVRGYVKLESDRELESHMLAILEGGQVIHQHNISNLEVTQVVAAGSTADFKEAAENEQLAKNFAAALGMNFNVAKAKFGGSKGMSEAEKYAKEFQRVQL